MSYQPFPSFADWGVYFNTSVVEQYAERLRQAKAAVTPEVQEKALDVATRYAAVDTGALEGLYTTDRGFTRTIATQSEFWQQALDLKGEQTKRSIQDALDAYDYVLDAVTQSAPITEKWIRELHAVITEHQESFTVILSIADQLYQEQRPLPHGEYKQLPNNPINRKTDRVHYYAAPEETSSEMARFIDELRSESFLGAHPVVQAAYAHYAYIRIHPFTDGNGRVARALASVYLYRNPGVPLVIFADQRDEYLDTLEAADNGSPESFVEFIGNCVVDTVRTVERSLSVATEQPVLSLDVPKVDDDWLSDSTVLAAARLQHLCAAGLKAALVGKDLPERLGVTVDTVSHGERESPSGYTQTGAHSWVTLHARSNGSDSTRLFHSYTIFAGNRNPEFLVVPVNGSGVLELSLREIDPIETMSVKVRLQAWAEGAVRQFIRELVDMLSHQRKLV